jgi:type IV fimbrial biogenesis protein FimT
MLTLPARARSQSGMTLIELAITLVVFALLIAMGAPSFVTWIRNTETRNAAESIMAGLHKAREEAVRRNDIVYFSFVSLADPKVVDASCSLSASAGSWVVSLDSPSSDCHGLPEGKTTGVKDEDCSGTSAANLWCKPYIVEAHPAADGGANVGVAGKGSDNATAANRILFNGLGRAWTAAAPFPRPDGGTDAGVQCIDVTSTSSDPGVRQLRVEVTDGGAVRMCDRSITDSADSRKCRLCI